MGRNGKPTRDKILSESKELIYENGFAGTSIDLILNKTGITKGAFFYHFKTKADLALVLMQNFASTDLQGLEQALTKTEVHVNEPKKRLLEFIQCYIDMFSKMEDPPGCLYASVSNEQNQYSQEIKAIVGDTLLKWRHTLEEMISAVEEKHTPKTEIDKVALADHFTVVIEGAFIMSKALNDPLVTAKQLILFKNYIELLFQD